MTALGKKRQAGKGADPEAQGGDGEEAGVVQRGDGEQRNKAPEASSAPAKRKRGRPPRNSMPLEPKGRPLKHPPSCLPAPPLPGPSPSLIFSWSCCAFVCFCLLLLPLTLSGRPRQTTMLPTSLAATAPR